MIATANPADPAALLGLPPDAPLPVFLTRHAALARLPLHRHAAPFFALVLEGVYEESSVEGTWRCEPGDLVVHPAWHLHVDRFTARGGHVLGISLPTNPALNTCYGLAIVRALERRETKLSEHVLAAWGHFFSFIDDIRPGQQPFPAAILALASSWCAFSQTYSVQTLAGGGLPVNIAGTAAILQSPGFVAVDRVGNVFFADRRHVVLRLDATTGFLTLVAGNGTAGYSGDNGPATSAQLHTPLGVSVDSNGDLYITDSNNNSIRKVSNG